MSCQYTLTRMGNKIKQNKSNMLSVGNGVDQQESSYISCENEK